MQTTSLLPLLFQYTIEAYKTFEKLAELLPNPMSSAVFQGMAKDERHHRDLLEIRYLGSGSRIAVTLIGDLRFQEILEGDLSHRETVEWLISREKAMHSRLRGALATVPDNEKNILRYVAESKRAHVVLLERELELLREYADWFRREDAEDLIAHGSGE